jgi:hypothetical protein
MTSCPDCCSSDLESLGLERGERIDQDCAVLVSLFQCKVCRCQFRETQTTEWTTEIIFHGWFERLILLEQDKV